MKPYTVACILGALFLPAATTVAVPRIILDTDMRGDCDDAGALGMLHALADNGECEILGVMASTTGPHVVGAIAAINAYYGRPYLPVGLYDGEGTHGGDDYAPVVGDPAWFPAHLCNDTAPDSTTLYRRLLYEAPDNSVSIVVIGGQPCVYELLQSEADHEGDGSINMTGAELAEAKVKELVLMAAHFTNPDHREWNVILDVVAAQTVARDWPGTIVFSGFEIGHVIRTGARLQAPQTNPVAMSYKLYRGTDGGQGVIGDRMSWDQTAVYYAVRGLEHEGQSIWGLAGPVSVSYTDEGHTRFEEVSEGNRFYFTQEMDIEATEKLIEDLMVQPPRVSARLASPTNGQAFVVDAEVALKASVSGLSCRPGTSSDPTDVTMEASVTARNQSVERVVFLVDGTPVTELTEAPYTATWRSDAPGTHEIQAFADTEDGARFYTRVVPVSIIDAHEPVSANRPAENTNLASAAAATLSGSVAADEGRGTPEAILFDPAQNDYALRTDYNEYGVAHGQDLGLVTEEAPFYWQAQWDKPMNVNEITIGGAYGNQPQPFAMWKVQYRHDDAWHVLLEGRGGWLNTGIFQWGGPDGPVIVADAVRVIAYSDGVHPLVSTHLRGRGGQSENVDDRGTTPKATLIRYR